jgi:phosphatidylglycerol:prolipoprotein diacylglycerol transferase
MTQLLEITIGMNPNVGNIAGLLITWHGVFTAFGIVAGVWLSVNLARSPRINIDEDTGYTLGMIIVFCGIIGARLLYVVERYGDSPNMDDFMDILRITEGGISIYGAIIGGAIGGWAYGLWKKLPAAAGADAAGMGMLLGLAIGRIGDIINGEHFAKATDLPWGVVYTHPNSPGFEHSFTVGPWHPAVGYELIGDLVILGVLALLWRRNLKDGVIFTLAFLLYAVMRFFVSFLRIDSKDVVAGLSTPQFVSVLVIAVAVPLLIYFLKRPRKEGAWVPPAERSRLAASRAERRRRLRTGS